MDDLDGYKYDGCEYCRHYWSGHQQMYCKHLKRGITARKKPCNKYDDIRNENK